MAKSPRHVRRNRAHLAMRKQISDEAREFKLPARKAEERRAQRRAVEQELRQVRSRELALACGPLQC